LLKLHGMDAIAMDRVVQVRGGYTLACTPDGPGPLAR
jgi:hypothetical protein